MLEESGGAKEIMDKYNKYGKEYFYLNRMFNEYRKVFDGVDIKNTTRGLSKNA